MATYTIPTTVGFSSVEFGLENNNQVFESPLSNSIQVSELTGARWYATFNLPPMKKENSLEYIGFFYKDYKVEYIVSLVTTLIIDCLVVQLQVQLY